MLKSFYRYAIDNICPDDKALMDIRSAIILNCELQGNVLVCNVGSGSHNAIWKIHIYVSEEVEVFNHGHTPYLCDPETKLKLDNAYKNSVGSKTFSNEDYRYVRDTLKTGL